MINAEIIKAIEGIARCSIKIFEQKIKEKTENECKLVDRLLELWHNKTNSELKSEDIRNIDAEILNIQCYFFG